jgi:hypothetical protein
MSAAKNNRLCLNDNVLSLLLLLLIIINLFGGICELWFLGDCATIGLPNALNKHFWQIEWIFDLYNWLSGLF